LNRQPCLGVKEWETPRTKRSLS